MVIRRANSKGMIILIEYLLLTFGCIFIIPDAHRNTYMLYMGVLTLSLFFATLCELSFDYNKFFFWISIILLASIMAFRAQTALDDEVYSRIFDAANNIGLVQYFRTEFGLEPGFLLVTYFLFHILDGNYIAYQIIFTYLTFVIIGIAIYSFKDKVSIPGIILVIWTHYYFHIMSAGLIRMFIAVAIVLYAIHFLEQKRAKAYILAILLAASFHISSLIMLVFLLLFLKDDYFIDHWRKTCIILAIILPFAFIFIAKFIIPILGVRYFKYDTISSFSFSIDRIDMLPIFFIGAYYIKSFKEEQKRSFVIGVILLLFAVIVSLCSSIVSLGRIGYLANIGVLLMVSMVMKKDKGNNLDDLIITMVILYLFVYMMHAGFLDAHIAKSIFPYISIFN